MTTKARDRRRRADARSRKRPAGTRSIRLDCVLDETPAQVWRALTTPNVVASWMRADDAKDNTAAGVWEPLDADPPRRLRWRWRIDAEAPAARDTIVTFTLRETQDGGTHLRLVHAGLPIVASRHGASRMLMSVSAERPRRRPPMTGRRPLAWPAVKSIAPRSVRWAA